MDQQIEDVAVLGEPVRRALYRYVASRAAPVGREEAADAVGVPVHTAKFHLDKLVDEGLLEVGFARPEGRRGPGAGRPAKLYRRADREVSVSLPPRHYDLAGRLLAQAVSDATASNRPVADALAAAARRAGHAVGEEAKERAGRRPSRAALRRSVVKVLGECGYEPQDDERGAYLANCPFHSLAREYTDLVCGMNLDFIDGMVEGAGAPGLEAEFAPTPGRCCVRLNGR